jgi:hypothetical protein
MKYLKNFFQLNESQSKKIKKVLTFSVVLDWYNDNKDKIASIIGCEPEELASEEELITQSRGLVNNVINTQSDGNKGNDDIEIAGFDKFRPLDQYLLHDILHSIYDVSKKDFDKSLSDIEFTESEVFEEIEILCIEESFMKFCNIRYPKTDFINQNINQLASFLMMVILKNDPTRIKDILDEKIDPYLEIYGVKYIVKEGSPYEDFFLTLKGNFRDMPKINNSDDFKNYMINLINVGEGIDYSSGDRANYPDGGYYGQREFSDATESEIDDIINSMKRWNTDYIILSSDDIYDIEDLKEKGISLSSNSKYVNNIDYDNLSQLKLPFRKKFLEQDGYIKVKEWFEYLSNLSNKYFYENNDNIYLVISKDGDESYNLVDKDDFNEKLSRDWNESDDVFYDSGHAFIDFEMYKKMSFEEVSKKLFNDDNSVAIMRRNFRDNDIIANNTKLGNIYNRGYNSWLQREIPLKGDKNYTDFTSDREDKVSISKNVITNNGKKLLSVLNNIRGYSIKNFKELKNLHKLGNKFTKEDINNFVNLNIEIFESIQNYVIYHPNYTAKINLEKNMIEVEKNYKTTLNFNYLRKIDSIISLLSKIQNKYDINLLKSYLSKNKTPINTEDKLVFYSNILNNLLENREKLKKLLEFDNNIIKGRPITEEESDDLKQTKIEIRTNREEASNSLSKKIINLIKKYYDDYDVIVTPPYYYYTYYDNIPDIVMEIKKPV